MLARCPSCDQRFPVVGSCVTACPFCEVRVQVGVQRLVGVPQAAARGPVGGERVASAGGDPIASTLPPAALGDKISGDPPAGSAPTPTPPPPRLGPPRAGWLFLQPAEFFARLERGRPRVRPEFGYVLLVLGAAVQGASWGPLLSSGPSPLAGAAAGATVGLAFALYLLAAYRTVLRWSTAREQVGRVGSVLGYGLLPMALLLIPFGGLPAALGTSAAAHARGLEHHLGLSTAAAQATVLVTWVLFGVVAVALTGGVR